MDANQGQEQQNESRIVKESVIVARAMCKIGKSDPFCFNHLTQAKGISLGIGIAEDGSVSFLDPKTDEVVKFYIELV